MGARKTSEQKQRGVDEHFFSVLLDRKAVSKVRKESLSLENYNSILMRLTRLDRGMVLGMRVLLVSGTCIYGGEEVRSFLRDPSPTC